MNVKQTCVLSKRRLSIVTIVCAILAHGFAFAQTNQFVGAQSCASSSCHGGADPKSNQNLIWSQHDPHSKSFATLITSRSERIAESLNISTPAKNSRCTVCHAPFATVPVELAATVLDPAEGVSCESCHGMAKSWLRSHTRKDLSHDEKVGTGMRDLRNLYNRANACVACHQNVDADILKAGHPELIFELDGQSVSEPRHWQEQTNWSGAQTWLVGQAVALREISWSIENKSDPHQKTRWEGLISVLGQTDAVLGSKIRGLDQFRSRDVADVPSLFSKICDSVAKDAAKMSWNTTLTKNCLLALANSSNMFRDSGVERDVQARRAERLVLGLDRLVVAENSKDKATDAALNRLFKLAQSLPDFDPKQFADALDDFAKTLK